MKLGKPCRPVDMRDLEEFKRQLPPGRIVLRVEVFEPLPVDLGCLDFADQRQQFLGKPHRVRRARRRNHRRSAMKIDDGLGQAASPGGDQPGKFQRGGNRTDRRQEVETFREAGVKKAAVVIRLAERANGGEDGGAF
jgi:hypothetical protein